MGVIARERYLQKLIDRKENDMIKVITGIRSAVKVIFYSICITITCFLSA